MQFQFYNSFTNKAGRRLPGVRAKELTMSYFYMLAQSDQVKKTISLFRKGEGEKTGLPAITWCGITRTGYRKAENMTPTGFFMMDYDHVGEDLRKVFEEHKGQMAENKVLLVHITPSGRGLRIVARCKEGTGTLAENMEWLHKVLNLGIGDYDEAVKDISRLSFCPQIEDVLYVNEELWREFEAMKPEDLPQPETQQPEAAKKTVTKKTAAAKAERTEAAESTEEHKAFTYKGHLVSSIMQKYVDVFGTPEEGERHNFYNQMVKYFRNICDNDPQLLCDLLPRFDPDSTDESCLSQCQSICRTNTTGKLPREFYLFLVKNGFYKQAEQTEEPLTEEDVRNALAKPAKERVPEMPPVFREIVRTCPQDFVVPCVNALLPVMGTLTSNVRAVYPYDARQHSTEFFSIVYAPPGTGKGFIERFISLLHRNIELRDMLSDRKESIFAAAQMRKGDNERSPENPHVSKRVMEAKNSETDFLEKQQANKGHHMFTYAAEMDQWRKGVRAAGGNKDDMIRIAWDNGYYGQSFKSPNSFKGRVRLYWNVLITGTRDQLDAYFRNVTNGLVTRCGFSDIKNQEFAEAPKWGELTKQDMEVINRWVDKQDKAEYARPVNFDINTLDDIADDDFDKEVPWKHVFNEPQVVDINWIMPTIERWLNKQREEALKNQNLAQDVFRRRVAVRGFRLALLCTTLYDSMGKAEQKTVSKFVEWWMGKDIENILALYGEKYNEVTKEDAEHKPQNTLWEELPQKFTVEELQSACVKCCVLSPVRNIISVWKKRDMITYNKQKKEICKKK